MSIEYGPQSFGKLVTGSKVNHLQKHKNQEILLLSTEKQTLECHYIKKIKNKQINLLKMKEISLLSDSHLFGLTNKHIIHCQDNLLKINNRHELKHESTIKHLLIDQENIALTTYRGNIKISSMSQSKVQGQLRHQGEDISSIFWNNSLVISGNKSGFVHIWDINKQHIVNGQSISQGPIDIINVHADFIHKNLYYTISKGERKINYFDLRTFKQISCTEKLPKGIVDVKHNKSGKIFIMSQNQLQFLDIYKGFDLLGKFCQVQPQNKEQFMRSNANALLYYRSLHDMLIWDQFVLLGCSNGCIQVYNSDTNKCLYAFGMGQFSGIKKLLRIDQHLISLEDNGNMQIARMI